MRSRFITRVTAYGFGLILAACVGYSGALVVANQLTPSTPTPPHLEVADRELDLGERFESTSHEHRFHLVNPTDSPVRVTALSGSCDCQGWTPAVPFTIPPHGQQEVRVRLALSPSSDCGRTRGGEQLVMPIRVTFAGPTGVMQSQEYELRGVVRPVLRTAGHLALGMQTAGQLAAEREIELTAAEPVEAVGCQAPTHWDVTVRRAAAGSAKFTASLRFVGLPTPTVIDDTIVFIPTDARGQSFPGVRMQITGELVEDVVASPRSAYFGRYVVGSVIEEAVILKSLTGKPFTIREAVSRMAGCRAERGGGELSDSVWVIRQKVAAVGQHAGELEFVVDDGTGAIIRVVVPVSYLGVER